MAIFESKGSFIKQISIYLRNEDYAKAYELSKEFSVKHPNEMIASYLVAKSAFWLEKYDEAAREGCRAFDKAKPADMGPCAAIAASAYYQLGKYKKGHELLEQVRNRGSMEIEKLRLSFALAMENDKEAADIIDELLRINRKEAMKLLGRMLL